MLRCGGDSRLRQRRRRRRVAAHGDCRSRSTRTDAALNALLREVAKPANCH
jgi:hypothetical protein